MIVKASNNHQGPERAAEWIGAADASLELYGTNPAVAFADLAAEVATEVRLLRAVQSELTRHAAERETAYRWVDPAGLARSLPGLAEIGAANVVAIMGDPARFAKGKQFRSFTGLVAADIRDRRHEPQRPAHVQGRFVAATHHIRARR